MGLTRFPHGVSSFGIPVVGNRYAGPWATHYFVDGVNGSDSNSGLDPSKALSTIDAAVQKCTVGDVVYIRPKAYVVGTGHARYEGAITVDLEQSDISLIGTGYPKNSEFGVRFKTTAGYGCTINAPSTHMENIGWFVSAGDGSVKWASNGATSTTRGSDGPTIYNCHFKGGTDYMQGGQSAAFHNCRFHYDTGSLIIADSGASSYGLQIRDCNFLDNNGAAPTGPYIQWGGAHAYNVWIDHCRFGRTPTNGYINMGGTLGTGIISGCYVSQGDVTLNTAFPGATNNTLIFFTGNYDATNNIIA